MKRSLSQSLNAPFFTVLIDSHRYFVQAFSLEDATIMIKHETGYIVKHTAEVEGPFTLCPLYDDNALRAAHA